MSGPAAARSTTHLVLIPSYTPGRRVFETIRGARAQWSPVWVVVDGSTDGTAEQLVEMGASDEGLNVLRLPKNRGKGAAVFLGIQLAQAAGFTHVLVMDSDGQHPVDRIADFMQRSIEEPDAMIL